MKTRTAPIRTFTRACAADKLVGVSLVVALGSFIGASAHGQVVVGWGSNAFGQLTGTNTIGAVSEISTGFYHNVATRSDGTAVAWGFNSPLYQQTAVPAELTNPATAHVECVAAGDYHSIALRADGSVLCWGNNFDGQCDVPAGLKNIVAVSGGESFSGVLRADGTVVVWGLDNFNRLAVPADLNHVIKLDLGLDYGLSLRAEGNIRAWGDSTAATRVPGEFNFKDIASGYYHSMGLRTDGSIVCWGGVNQYGECTVPASAINVAALSAGDKFSVALRTDGTVVCWGRNNLGQAPATAAVTQGIAIASGFQHSIANTNPSGFGAGGLLLTPTITLVSSTNASCGLTNGAIDVTVANADDTVWWTGPSDFFSNNQDLSGLAAGTYILHAVGNGGSATLEVTLIAGADTGAPAIVSHNAAASAPAGQDCTALVPDFTASVVATDACADAASLVVTQSPLAGASVGLGAHTVTITVTDPSDNESSVEATFTVTGTASLYYTDADLDTFGANNVTGQSACTAVAGKVTNNGDCDDADDAIHPGATEVCDQVDQNCDGVLNDGLPTNVYYTDADSDGYGASNAVGVPFCVRLPGTTTNNADCNDNIPNIYPGAPELCANSTIDNDCDGNSTEVDADAADKVAFYRDQDLDGSSINVTALFCPGTTNAGYLASLSSPADCNDGEGSIHPGAAELCADATIDNDCDGNATEVDANAADKVAFYRDQDLDGYSINSTALFCPGTTNAGYLASLSSPIDCNDSNSSAYPGAVENCANDGVDNDCDGESQSDLEAIDATPFYLDGDSDLFGAGTGVLSCIKPVGRVANNTDCNDGNAAINPAATEVCDASNTDEDCDALADDADPTASDATKTNFYLDSDGDSYGAGAAARSCDMPAGYSVNNTDCNDGNSAINPGATEICDAGNTDEDCDGSADNNDPSAADAGKTNFYLDNDSDTYGAGAAARFCDLPVGYSANNTDCNDSNSAINPGATEVCDASNTDEDCDLLADDADSSADDAGKTNFYIDSDLDTYGAGSAVRFCDMPAGYSVNNTDCNNSNSAINPGATEVCDGIDNDCLGGADNDLIFLDYFVDGDSDTYGAGSATNSCNPIAGSVTRAGDCNDGNSAINPGAAEICDQIDQDCDGILNDGLPVNVYYTDADSDGFGASTAVGVEFCERLPGTTTNNADCNDGNAAINPTATEVCDPSNTDEDCDGLADNNDPSAADAGKTNFYLDSDDDNFGAGPAERFCDLPTTHSVNNTDCNDGNSAINPGATEICDQFNTDEDCDTLADNNDSSAADAGRTTFYADADLDTFSGSTTARFCDLPIGFEVANDGDCNDSNAAVYPGAVENCANDGVDNDCDGEADSDLEAIDATLFYLDADSDLFGAGPGVLSCIKPVGRVADNTDCNDGNSAINPGAQEVCDALNTDEDCDSLADNNDPSAAALGKTNFYIDSDLDTYGAGAAVLFCDLPAGYSVNNTDCNNFNSAINPGATEVCDPSNTDEDCDTLADNNDPSAADAGKSNFYLDSDDDNYGAGSAQRFCDLPATHSVNNTDCNDGNGAINPGATEVCDASNTDEDCDTLADNNDPSAADAGKTNFYLDSDDDNYGAGAAERFCDLPATHSVNNTDCDDNNGSINPAAQEVCDLANTDEDCDGAVDDADSSVDEATKTTFYADADSDTFSGSTTGRFCDLPAGFEVANDGDCNDGNPAINPAAQEVCDLANTDEDCDGAVDDADLSVDEATKTAFYADSDADGFSGSTTGSFCDLPAAGYEVANDGDCDDGNVNIYPGAPEQCNDIDDNCNQIIDDGITTQDWYPDNDQDGFGSASATPVADCRAPAGYVLSHTDCNDNDSSIKPTAQEVCDPLDTDEDCDGFADNADPSASDASKFNFYADADLDTYTVAAATRFCDIVPGYLAAPSALVDCNDGNSAINPGATEVCDPTNTDEDCDALADNADPSASDASKFNFYADADLDSYTVAAATRFCDIVPGYLAAPSALVDCNDGNSAINPGATEVCDPTDTDEDCDTLSDNADPSASDASKFNFYADADSDSYTVAAATRFCDIVPGHLPAPSALVDCNDGNGAINPGAQEVCDPFDTDEDCDLLSDNADPSASDASMFDFYADADNDSYTVPTSTRFCDIVTGYLGAPSALVDCNDGNGAINPGAQEVCDPFDTDEDCDLLADNADPSASDASKFNFYADADSDSYTVAAATRFCDIVSGYLGAPSALVDCNDTNNAIHPGAVETCANIGVDDDCDGDTSPEEAVDADDYYQDTDADHFGAGPATRSCTPINGKVTDNTDCNDNNSNIYPGAPELCDGKDNDCDTEVDDGLVFVDYFVDGDSDNFGAGPATSSCSAIAGSVTTSGDCNDNNNTVYPGAPEICDGLSNDCEGPADEGLIFLDYFVDGDSDTYGADSATNSCNPIAGSVTRAGDCNDNNNAINPDATEICDGVDNDCDARVDDGLGSHNWYADTDGDGHGVLPLSFTSCNATEPGYAENFDDGCPNDGGKVNPGICGCGNPDVNSDPGQDTYVDCLDIELSMIPMQSSIEVGVPYRVRINAHAIAPLIPMNGMQLAAKFDTTRLELVAVIPFEDGPFSLEIGEQRDNSNGTLKYAIGVGNGQFGMTGSADIADLIFAVKPTADLCTQDVQLARLESVGTWKNLFVTNTNIGVFPTLFSLAFTDLDTTDPVIGGVPASVDIATDAGSTFGALVATPTVTVDDNCAVETASLLITYPDLSTADAWPLDEMFPIGHTTLHWSATDPTGNVTTYDRTIDVQNYQLLDISIAMDTVQRAASLHTVRITTGLESQLVVVETPLVGAGTKLGIQVPVASSYSCISAKDIVHSLSDTDVGTIVGRRYQSSFILLEGDSNDDNRVDVLDFSLWVTDQGEKLVNNGRSNFNADLIVNNADFGAIGINFFKRGETCDAGATDEPLVTRISVKELRRRGLGDLTVADMNGDGWVDLRDIQLFMQGGQTPEASNAPDQGPFSGW